MSTIDLLKIDIEGYEFDETAYWSIKDPWLPEQIAIEVHHSQAIYSGKAANTDFSNLLWPAHDLYLSDLALFFGHLGHLGYAIASREDNPFGRCCAPSPSCRLDMMIVSNALLVGQSNVS